MKRTFFIIIVAIVVIGAIIWGFMPTPVSVDIATVTIGELRVTVDEEGKTRVMDRFVVSAPVAGFARRVELDVGDQVKKGQKLVELEPQRSRVLDARSRAEAKATVSAAKASLKAAEQNEIAAAAESGYAKKGEKRAKELYKEGFVTRDKLDHAEADSRLKQATFRSAKFAKEVATHELAAAKTALKYSKAGSGNDRHIHISAPVAGRVLKLHRESEGVVAEGEALVELGDPRALEVEADLLSADAVKVGPGTAVLFNRWGGEGSLEGRVRVVEPTGFTKVSALGVEEQRVLVIVDITSPRKEWTKLGDGYRVEASFILWQAKEVLQVPSSALFRFEDGWAAFTLEGDKAVRKVVKVGKRNGFIAEVAEGLTEGETVIVHPDDSIEDGARVKVR